MAPARLSWTGPAESASTNLGRPFPSTANLVDQSSHSASSIMLIASVRSTFDPLDLLSSVQEAVFHPSSSSALLPFPLPSSSSSAALTFLIPLALSLNLHHFLQVLVFTGIVLLKDLLTWRQIFFNDRSLAQPAQQMVTFNAEEQKRVQDQERATLCRKYVYIYSPNSPCQIHFW